MRESGQIATVAMIVCALAAGILAVTMMLRSGTPANADAIAEMSTRRAVAAMAARDGYPPTPTPTPALPPRAFPECYGTRAEESSGFTLLPASDLSIFANCQVIAYYGYPGVPALGVLSQSDPVAMLARLRGEVAAHDAANGTRRAIGAMEIIAAVAQATPQEDGSYLSRIPLDLLEEQIAFANANDLLVILDLQMGHSTVEVEVSRVLPYLVDSRVHIALDPEWAMPAGVVPGTEIGGMDASAVNQAAAMISTFAAEHHLRENRTLIVHQFTESMIRSKEQLQPYPGVDLLIDMDGFGGQGIKIAHYTRFVGEDGAPHGGIKLFYRDDVNLMTAGEVAALAPQPDFVVYQ